MSLKSMTGFGAGHASAGGLKVDVELGSVNRKQFDLRVSLPRTLAVLEPRVRERVQSRVARGSLTATVRISVSGRSQLEGVTVDQHLSQVYVKALRQTAKELHLEDDLTASVLLRLPEVIRYREITEDSDKVWRLLKKALSAALAELVDMRKREGASLADDLEARLERLATRRDTLLALAPKVPERYRARLRKRLAEAGVGIGDVDDVVARELVVFVDRADITEELVRLESHFKQARRLLRMKTPAGRSLDFLCQEMFREINTIGSKGNDSRISKEVISFKAELEAIREQVQNIE
jgi:uncharacterized protein (TIGR00255 family)